MSPLWKSMSLGALAVQLAFGQAVLSPTPKVSAPAPETSPPEIVAPETLLPNLPPMPRGKATLIGGSLSRLDRVRDQLTVQIFGGQKMKVAFDERTHVYREGEPGSQRDLQPGQKLYIDTMLDGSTIFARNIRIVSQSSTGSSQGQVLSYDSNTGELEMRDQLSPRPLRVHIAAGTPILHEGQQVSSDLIPGALVAVQFQPGKKQPEARQVLVLATPGSAFTFTGRITFLDVHAGLLTLVDPRDKKSYEVSFDPDRVSAVALREGAEVTVTAAFDGTCYLASAFHVN
jgi:hypothetical protein